MNMNNLMLDIESLGSTSNSVILSIGAVEFDINTGETGRTFYETIDLEDCLRLGLKVSAGTIKWWLQQSESARSEIYKHSGAPLNEVLQKFSEFCSNKKYIVWGNSARFDCGILQDSYNLLGLDIPWDFRDERCLRTLVQFAPEVKRNLKFKGTKHNAIDDCMFQIEYCSKIWNLINN